MWERPLLGCLLLVGASVAYPLALAWVRRMDRAFPSTNPTESTWWFGYLRDGINLLGLSGYTVGFWLSGFPGPLAWLTGFAATMAAYGLDYLLARTLSVRRAALALAALMLVVVVPLFAAREAAVEGLSSLLQSIFAGQTARRERG